MTIHPVRLAIFILFSSAHIFAGDEPPKVTQTVPENAAGTVSVDLKEIRVTFDQSMSQSGFSFVGGGPGFPEVTGRPFWADDRTCVLPVKLKGATKYTVRFNSSSHRNFKSADAGIPAVPYILTFVTEDGEPTPVDTTKANEEAIRRLQEAIRFHYSYHDLRKVEEVVNWEKFEPKLKSAATPRRFAEIAGEMLAATEDSHIWFNVGKNTVPAFIRRVDANANFKWLSSHIKNWHRHNRAVATGMAAPEVGYIAIYSFGEPVGSDVYEPLFDALEKFSDLPSLILDVRFNAGGDERAAREFAGCFLTERRLYAKSLTVASTNKERKFSGPYERWLEPSKNRPSYSGKVAVLTGPAIMSSAEAFLLMMKQAPNAKLIGAPSYGSSGNPKPHILGNGVSVMLPSWQALDAAGEPFEGKGIAPDVAVDAEAGDFRKSDPVLEKAIEFLSN